MKPILRSRREAITGAALLLILALHAAAVVHRLPRSLDHDEAEHLRAAEWMASGRLLYRDFVENHTPFLYLILARFASVQMDFDAVRRYAMNARLLAAAAGTAAALCVALFAAQAAGDSLAMIPALVALLAGGWTSNRALFDIRSEPFTLLLFWAGVLLIIREDRPLLNGLGAGLIAAAMIWNPKWPIEALVAAAWYGVGVWTAARRAWTSAALSIAAACVVPLVAVFLALRAASPGALFFFGYRYPAAFYSWFRSTPLVPKTFRFPSAFEYCSPWFGPVVALLTVVLLVIVIRAQRRPLLLLLLAFVIGSAVEIRFVYSYPRLWPQYFVMWGCALAAVYGVIVAAAPVRPSIRGVAVGAALVLFAGSEIAQLGTPVDNSHWRITEAIVAALGPGEGVAVVPDDCALPASAGSYYWYAYKDQVPFSLAYARTPQARPWLPQLTEQDLPPCRMLDAHLHGLPRGGVYVRFVGDSIFRNLPQARGCLAALVRMGRAREMGTSDVYEIAPPPRQ
jgi:4-amino-4-deoxy-L-arabinose transferase-like glycosyltransferase